MKIVTIILIAYTCCGMPLRADYSPEVAAVMTSIKKLVSQDDKLQTFFSPTDSPEEFLEKAKLAALITRFERITTELRNTLNPALESLLGANSLLTRTPLQKAAAAQDDELRSLREEVARLRAHEKERLDTELAGFTKKLAQAESSYTTFSTLSTETKELIMRLRHDLQQIDNTRAFIRTSGIIKTQIETMRSFFTQHITKLEQCFGELSNKNEQLKTQCDTLSLIIKNQPSNLADTQAKVHEAWVTFNKINRLVDEIQQISIHITDSKTLVIQTKTDLEQRCETAKTSKKKN